MNRTAAYALAIALAAPAAATAAVKTDRIEYRDGDTALTGYLSYDDGIAEPRPGVLVIHEWWGLNDYAKKRAEMLAELGYVAFAADMYGDNKVTAHAEDAKGWMMQITENVDAWQRRAIAGLDVLKSSPKVNPEHIATIGYCFGGATVMQLAYAGADIDGVVSFHGSLPPATPEQQKNIHAPILVAHGAQDGFVPPERITAFKNALEEAGADWQMMIYSGARHGFTNPGAATYGIDGIQYDAKADARSWALMQSFFNEIFTN